MEVMQKQMSNEPAIHCSLSFLLLLLGTGGAGIRRKVGKDWIRKARKETKIITNLG